MSEKKNLVMIGNEECSVSDPEFALARMQTGQPIRWNCRKPIRSSFGSEPPLSGAGIFLLSWLCQDIIAGDVLVGGRRICLMPYESEEWTIEPAELGDLNEPNMHGCGI